MNNGISHDTLLEIAKIIGGEEGVKILEILHKVEDITVEELSEKTGIDINNVRKLLYKFYNHSIVASKRFRDKETGWFIFQWRLQPELLAAFIQGLKQKILKKLQTKLEYELSHEFYHCGNPNCPKISFEEAMETVFHCPTCNSSLKLMNNIKSIDFLKRKISEIEEELKD